MFPQISLLVVDSSYSCIGKNNSKSVSKNCFKTTWYINVWQWINDYAVYTKILFGIWFFNIVYIKQTIQNLSNAKRKMSLLN